MSTIIISIKPQYVSRIMSGDKHYEYRKVICKKKIDKMIIYSTYPESKIVGEVEVECVLIDSPSNIWQMTNNYSGMTRKDFDKYFDGKKKAVAYKLSKFSKYDIPQSLKDYGIKTAPQSFYYICK